MSSIEVDRITTDRSKRQRRALTNIEEMMDSLQRRGQIQNIVISSDYELVAGERRLEAAKRLGWTHIEAKLLTECSQQELHAIELEENIKRVNLDWKDECKAILQYHEYRKSEESDWTFEKTAESLGYSNAHILQRIQVAKEIISGNEMVTAAPRYSTARGIVRRAEDRAVLSELLAVKEFVGSPITQEIVPILTADFNIWAPTYDGPKFNFIHCDFPYGIGADKFNQGAAASHGGYDDSEETYWKLITSLLSNLDRLASDQCHIMFWFSMQFYDSTREYITRNSNFRVDRFPLVWVKSDNIGILPDPERGPRRIYETALFGSRGDRKVARSVSNAIAFPSQRDEHMSIKPEGMLTHFFRMFVDSSTIMLDPTCGSGGALRASKNLGAARVLGLERSAEFAERARLAYKTGVRNG